MIATRGESEAPVPVLMEVSVIVGSGIQIENQVVPSFASETTGSQLVGLLFFFGTYVDCLSRFLMCGVPTVVN
jgi:hypothetical protein